MKKKPRVPHSLGWVSVTAPYSMAIDIRNNIIHFFLIKDNLSANEFIDSARCYIFHLSSPLRTMAASGWSTLASCHRINVVLESFSKLS